MSRNRWPSRAALLLLLSAGCASLPQPIPEGLLQVAGPTLGTHQLKAGRCYSGERLVFLGAILVDEASQLEARVVYDPIAGPVVRVLASHDESASIVLRKAACSTFETHLDRTGSWTNGINEVKIRLRLDCRALNGDVVRGELTSDSCS